MGSAGGVFWFTHFSSFLTQDRRMIIIPVRRKCSLIQREHFQALSMFWVWDKRHQDVLVTSGGWWGRSRGHGSCWVFASPGESEFRSSYSWYHWSLVIIITDNWSSLSSLAISQSLEISLIRHSPAYCHQMSHYHFIKSHPRIRDTSSEKRFRHQEFYKTFAIFTHKNQINSINYF